MSEAAVIQIQRIAAQTIRVPIIGTASLIVNNWSAKSKQKVLDGVTGRKTPKEPKNPEQEYQDSLYRTDDGYGFPLLAFKAATVGAARFFGKSVPMTVVRQSLFMTGVTSKDRSQLLTPIVGEPKLREDMVRVGMNGTEPRFRAEFLEWSATLTVMFVQSMLSRDSVLSLIDAGGMGVGVGEWRPEKRGQNGTFAIDESRQIEVVR